MIKNIEEKIVFNLISFKKNINDINYFIYSVLKQCDILIINPIDYNEKILSRLDDNLKNDKKIIINKQEPKIINAIFDNYKKFDDNIYFFILEDNVKYPFNYSEVLISKFKKIKEKYVYFSEGMLLSLNKKDDFKKNEISSFLNVDTEINFSHYRTACFYKQNLKITKKDYEHIENDLINSSLISLFLNKNLKMFCVSKIKYWIKEREKNKNIYSSKEYNNINKILNKNNNHTLLKNNKKNICLIYDIKGWAYYNKSLAIKKYLSDYYNFYIKSYLEPIFTEDYDLILSYSPACIPKENKIEEMTNLNNFICGISSFIDFSKRLSSLKNLECIFVNNHKLYEKIKEKINKKIYYVPNGVDISVYKSNKTLKEIDINEIRIAAVGSHKRAEHKGKYRVDLICENLKKSGYNIKNSSIFLNPKKDKKRDEKEMIEFYDNLDIFLVSSVSEATPNPLLEAMSMGVPCISNNTGMAELLMENNKTGYLIEDFNDLHQYEFFIKKLIDNPEIYKDISLNSKSKIKEYDWSEMVFYYKKMFDDILK